MSEPNRLRTQVLPTQAADRPAGRSLWTWNRIATTAAIGELLVLVVVEGVVSTASAPSGWTAFYAWLILHTVLGLGLGVASAGWRTIIPGIIGVGAAGVLAGVTAAIASALKLIPDQTGSSALFYVLATPVLVLILASPVVASGIVLGNVPANLGERGRRRRMAVGQLPLDRALETRKRTNTATKPLDAFDSVNVTEGGAVTTLVRVYPLDGGEDMLAVDTTRLGSMGYALGSVIRTPAKTGLGWAAVKVAFAVLAFAAMWSGTASGDPGIDLFSGRITATFKLTSPEHRPVTGPG